MNDRPPADDWIGVEDVAAELRVSPRIAWELVRRLEVPVIDPGHARMQTVRFRRADWMAARDGAMKPVPTRASRVRPSGKAPAAKPEPVTRPRLTKLRNA
jgi:hypothetical protein